MRDSEINIDEETSSTFCRQIEEPNFDAHPNPSARQFDRYTIMVLDGVDEDQIHLEETVVGQKLLNSIVTKVKVDVQDTDDKYQIKKWITLQNGVVLISEYWKEKAGEVYKSSESSIELPPHVLAEQQAKKDEARAKARELLQQRRAEDERKHYLAEPNDLCAY